MRRRRALLIVAAPTTRPPRIVAPDVARGLALFGIAWANIPSWASTDSSLAGATFGGVGPGGTLDQIAVVLSAMFAHVRGLPMFSTLLGFGVGLITVSLWRRAYPAGAAQATLAKRYGILAGIGALHCLFLFFGDIIFLYSMLALVLIAMIRLSDKTLLIIAGVLYSLHLLVTLGGMALSGSMDLSKDMSIAESYPGYLLFNVVALVAYLFTVPISGLSILPLMILGFVAARRGVHLRPEAHLRLLRSWVAATVAVVLLIGLPLGLSAIGVLPTGWETYLSGLNEALGFLCGPGIASAVLLACRSLQRKVDSGDPSRSLPLTMVTALGKRSMSGYLLQSVIFFVVCLPFTLGIGSQVGALGQMLMALGVWALTVLAAWVCELAGRNGPVEALHRRLSYGRDGLPARYGQMAVNERR